ncbi:hypothetical protein SELMODRAFT_430072 [Selaginella moellendorffii]|uniref:Endonuclease/exonuclease/phosphatase domain-containing protein n=1 Tax=Selaginella moellendorffii TaxID=88036 RepID=D8T887_SELML|nr:hypothetical protein SELMODRAFT_432263 [Selaginella moellendorffii]EFJ07095.1 hypothetical protein SELMODRAFT_430072 [Selaginella moellendorffii]
MRPPRPLARDRLRILFWNICGYPWNDGIGLSEFGTCDALCLVETKEHQRARLPEFPAFQLHSCWNWIAEHHSFGKGGIAIYVKREIAQNVTLEKVGEHNHWLAIRFRSPRQRDLLLVVAYFPPTIVRQKEQPFDSIGEEIQRWSQNAVVLIVGDFNSRIGRRQSESLPQETMDEVIPRSLCWLRDRARDTFQPDTGPGFLDFASAADLIVLNGTKRFPHSSAHTYESWMLTDDDPDRPDRGKTIIDYVLVPAKNTQVVRELLFHDFNPKSDHRPIEVVVNFVTLTRSLNSLAEVGPLSYSMSQPLLLRFQTDLQTRWEDESCHIPLEHHAALLLKLIKEEALKIFKHRRPRTAMRLPVAAGWWDHECQRLRRRYMHAHKRGGNT